MVGLIAAFQTTQRSAAIGEAREHIYQNARVALDLMARDIKNAYIDNRNRDLILVSADGLAGRANSIIEFSPNPPAAGPYMPSVNGLGNAQTPHGIDPTGTDVFRLYADESFGSPTYGLLSIKAIDSIYTLSPGPPDRLDLTCFTSNFPGNAGNISKLAEVRYMITTETFVDDKDNDYDTSIDEGDGIAGGLSGVGDFIPMARSEDFHPVTRKINALSLFQLRRGIGIDMTVPPPAEKPVVVDKNPFSAYEMATGDGTPADPQGRYPSRSFADFDSSAGGENIGSYIYDLQIEFYGKIAIALDSTGAPEVWGVGWGYQDVRGEDVGTDCDGDAALAAGDKGPSAIQNGTVLVTKESRTVNPGLTAPSWPAVNDKFKGGIFIVWPSSPPPGYTFDTADPNNDVYTITASTSTTLTLDREYTGVTNGDAGYRIIEPTQANRVLDAGEDLGADGLPNDPLDDIAILGTASRIPNNVSDNDGITAETSIGEGNKRLDSRVMGVWDSRSPDPRNPKRAAELDGVDSDSDEPTLNSDGVDDDQDGFVDDVHGVAPYATAEGDDLTTPGLDEVNDLRDNDSGGTTDGVADDRFYEPAGKGEGVDEPDEADPHDDSLPKAVRITIAVSDPQQTLKPVVLSTTVWLSTAR